MSSFLLSLDHLAEGVEEIGVAGDHDVAVFDGNVPVGFSLKDQRNRRQLIFLQLIN